MKSARVPYALLLATVLTSATNSAGLIAAVIYVNKSAVGANNGTSWSNAFTSLSDALSVAKNGDEIWVAKGTYKPEVKVDVNGDGVLDPREVTFRIPSGVKLYGGFDGTELTKAERDWQSNVTVLSGDTDNNDKLTNGIVYYVDDIVGNNAFHVIYTLNASQATRVDGFVINAGQANYLDASGLTDPNECGGGWYNDLKAPTLASSPTITNNTFQANYGRLGGGFFSNGRNTSTGEMISKIWHCNFRYNGAIDGGGIYIWGGFAMNVAPVIRGGEFYGNQAHSSGGAIVCTNDHSIVDSVRFIANKTTVISSSTAPGAGGAVFLVDSNAAFSTCYFAFNNATGNSTGPKEGGGGGAVYIQTSHDSDSPYPLVSSEPRFFNCGFYANSVFGNASGWGGAVLHYNESGILRPQYINCMFSSNVVNGWGAGIANFIWVTTEPQDYIPALEPLFVNCTFSKNNAGPHDQPFSNSGWEHNGVQVLDAVVVNSILTTNISDGNSGGLITYSHSLVQGSGGSGSGWNATFGIDGGSNIDAIPFFKNESLPLGADNVFGTVDDGLQLLPFSPGLNAGDANTPGLAGISIDITGAPRVQAYDVDMGAYEATGIIFYPIYLLTPWKPIPVGCLSCPWSFKFADEYFDNFTWDGPAQFTDYGDHGEVVGTIVNMRNREISFDVYLKLVERKTWAEWNRMGRSWLVHTPEAQSVALRAHEQWKYWELSDESYLKGTGEVTGTLRLRHSPEGYRTGFQLGEGANGYDGDFGISGGFSYEGDLSIGRENHSLQGVGSLNADAELCEADCASPATPSPETRETVSEGQTDNTSFVYPNPAHDVVRIQVRQMEGTFWVNIYSRDGQLRQSEPATGAGGWVLVSLNDHSPGMYYLQVLTPLGETNSQTIIIE